MRRHAKALLIAGAIVTSLAAAPVLLAQDSREPGMMGQGMMGGGMMGMMGSMMRMMEGCSQMMQGGSQRPNEQWRKAPPSPGEKN